MKSYKVEIRPTKEQTIIINQTIGVARYTYNLFIESNKIAYENKQSFITGYDFSKWLNNDYIPNNPDKSWLKESSSKAIKQSIMNAEMAYKRFFKKTSGFPKFKSKSDYGSYYLIGTIHVKRHKIQLPKLKWIKLKEKGYIPTAGIKSVTVVREGDRYFVSVLVEEESKPIFKSVLSHGIGLDLGLKDAIISPNGSLMTNFKNNTAIVKMEKSLKRQQRFLSRKEKGSKNWCKQKIKLQRLHRRIKNIKTDIKRKSVLSIVKENPEFITIENLNIKGMMKNKRLANSFQQIGLGYVVEWLKLKCEEYEIELRQVDRYFPSSQLCSNCNNKQKMPLHKRIYKCNKCGLKIDRDINASINLMKCENYTVLV